MPPTETVVFASHTDDIQKTADPLSSRTPQASDLRSIVKRGSSTDIIEDSDTQDWLVIAWFTSDYLHHAQRLSAQLKKVGAPHHLFAIGADEGTIRQKTRLRPSVLLAAMDLYPDRTLISLDVDCHVHRPIDSLATFSAADIAHFMKPRRYRFKGQRGRYAFGISDRVLVLRQTSACRTFLTDWLSDCRSPNLPPKAGSEWARSQTFKACHYASFANLSPLYAGIEHDDAPADAAITHVSENRQRKSFWRRFRAQMNSSR
jgi:hypothetical protein